MEHAIQKQILNYMDESKQWNKNLHGYRELHSTTTTLLQVTDFINEAADEGQISNAMLIDQSAAFDMVDPEILDQKLALYKFSDKTRNWLRSYLSHRSQYVNVGAAKSNIRSVKIGVPQGSVLGPILYTPGWPTNE